ncbi:hypothetical protein K502DRAFT_36933 [Neoconidiobolus thromboides FSU 785]|nr:hypothetical protein K502DRAFT_36933 [Neoconidiobolus thromboides FSU 785]
MIWLNTQEGLNEKEKEIYKDLVFLRYYFITQIEQSIIDLKTSPYKEWFTSQQKQIIYNQSLYFKNLKYINEDRFTFQYSSLNKSIKLKV